MNSIKFQASGPPHSIHTSPTLQDGLSKCQTPPAPGPSALRCSSWGSAILELLPFVPPPSPPQAYRVGQEWGIHGKGPSGHSRVTTSWLLFHHTESDAERADSGQAKTLVYFSISNILAITKINST